MALADPSMTKAVSQSSYSDAYGVLMRNGRPHDGSTSSGSEQEHSKPHALFARTPSSNLRSEELCSLDPYGDEHADDWETDEWWPDFLNGPGARDNYTTLAHSFQCNSPPHLCGLPLVESFSPCNSIATSPPRQPLSAGGSASPTSAVFAPEGGTIYSSSASPGCNSEPCLQGRDLLHHLSGTTDAANNQLDWQGLPTQWGGPDSPSSAHSLQLAASSRCDIVSCSSDVACWPSFGLEAMSADSPCTCSQSAPIQLLPDPSVGRSCQGRCNVYASQHFNSATSSVATSSDVQLDAVVSLPQLVPRNQSRGTRGGATCSPSAANQTVPLPTPNVGQPLPAAFLQQTRSSRAAAAAAAAAQQQPRRKRGRPRLYNTIVPVCDTAIACDGIGGMPGNGSTASMSVAYEPVPKRRGAKPKRDRNRATALATYYRRKAHTQELHSQLSDLRAEAHALQALFDLVEHSTQCADWTGPLIAKGCAATELLQVLLPDTEAALDVTTTEV